ncbi:MAG: IS4 family transposase [Ectobacillus sp.]
MKQSNTFLSLLQNLLSHEEIQSILQEIKYEDTARTLDVQTLIQYLVTAAISEWKSFRHGADVASNNGLPRVHYSTFSKKTSMVPFSLMKRVFHLIVRKCNRALRRELKFPKPLLIVDSTTMTVGKTRLPWAVYHGERSGVKLHVAYTPATEMPLQVVETIGLAHDGPVGEQLAHSDFILVEDRAYGKLKRLDQFAKDGQLFVIRLRENVKLHRPKGLQRLAKPNSPVLRDVTCQLGTEQSRTKKRHRVVIFQDDEGKEMRVVTNVMNVSAELIADMYKTRWKIETFFRWIKQYLNIPMLFGTTENAVFNQLYAALFAYVLLKWLFQQAKPHASRDCSFASFTRMLLHNTLPVDWQGAIALVLKRIRDSQGRGLPIFG